MDCKLFYEQQMVKFANAFKNLKHIGLQPHIYIDDISMNNPEFKSYATAVKKDCNFLGIDIDVITDAYMYANPYIIDNKVYKNLIAEYGYITPGYDMDTFNNKAIAKGILELIKSENVSKNMPIVVFGKSYNVGAPIITALIKEGYMVKILDSKSTKWEVQHCLDSCYWFILCANKPIINASQFLKDSYVLDCGYSIVDGKACGNVIYDITSEEIKDKRVTISDIHNGVNLLTRIGLLYNLLDFYLGAK